MHFSFKTLFCHPPNQRFGKFFSFTIITFLEERHMVLYIRDLYLRICAPSTGCFKEMSSPVWKIENTLLKRPIIKFLSFSFGLYIKDPIILPDIGDRLICFWISEFSPFSWLPGLEAYFKQKAWNPCQNEVLNGHFIISNKCLFGWLTEWIKRGKLSIMGLIITIWQVIFKTGVLFWDNRYR